MLLGGAGPCPPLHSRGHAPANTHCPRLQSVVRTSFLGARAIHCTIYRTERVYCFVMHTPRWRLVPLNHRNARVFRLRGLGVGLHIVARCTRLRFRQPLRPC